MTYELRHTFRLACNTQIGPYGAERNVGVDRLEAKLDEIACAMRKTSSTRCVTFITPKDGGRLVKVTSEKYFG